MDTISAPLASIGIDIGCRAGSHTFLGRLGCASGQRLKQNNGSPNVLPSCPQVPRQDRIGRVAKLLIPARASSC
jgi:hypothetical protein